MTKKPCNGIVHVREHTRDGTRIHAYQRACGRHNHTKLPNHPFNILEYYLTNNSSRELNFMLQTREGEEQVVLRPFVNSSDANNEITNIQGRENTQSVHTHENEESSEENQDAADDEDRAFIQIMNNEGFFSGPYYDTAGNITTGIGTNVENIGRFLSFDWHDSSGRLLTESEARTLYQTLQEQKASTNFNLAPQYQTNINNLAHISYERAEQMTRQDIRNSRTEVGRMVNNSGGNFDVLPPSSRVALTDAHYNMGSSTFNPNTFPNLFNAVARNDFFAASNEIHRRGVSEERNEIARRLMEDAAREYIERNSQ